MIKNTLLFFSFFLPFWLIFQPINVGKTDQQKLVEHKVEVSHPGNEPGFKESVTLIEVQDKEGTTIEYYANVKSVICLENVCKVVQVRIFWDLIGDYKRYELDEGVTLEKYEADVFDAADYKKLHHVMASKNSPFKNVKPSEILAVVDENDRADAVSGATALVLSEDETVPGAALSCFTLWHWANGEIVSDIRNISGASSTEKQYINYLLDKDQRLNDFALEQLIAHKKYSANLLKTVNEYVVKDDHLLSSAIQYFESAATIDYYNGSKELFIKGGKEQKVAILNSLLKTKQETPKNYYDSLSSQISSLKSFQEITLFLELMEKKNPNSKLVIDVVMPFLKSDFIVARRVFYFLSNQELTESQQQKVTVFYNKYENQL